MSPFISHSLEQLRTALEDALREAVPQFCNDAQFREILEYSLFPGGKRYRPLLLLATGAGLGATLPELMPFAVGVECLHNYSLIHDDLPCMDNDELRRGKPTVHKKYGETAAVLAGDALLTQAFAWPLERLSAGGGAAGRGVRALRELGKAVGAQGMVLGQVLDTRGEARGEAALRHIHRLKTGVFIEACVVAGALLAGQSDDAVEKLARAGRNAGGAFQLLDDIQDQGKIESNTLIKFRSVVEVRGECQTLVAQALDELSGFGAALDPLRELIQWVRP